ncbi:SAM-dependent methyltransferase [Mucilaginibacter phyllosphaerae]|uniref:16S rRNA (Cytidine1402-2'-O)-methyltransferase n=1 Tax=Mucilaginibacter phyllosphaerae TaxID=1812349 RepID=A0A4Y8A9S1_9SPHI|nr:SAM-dependent methyltransferase [Mucilaginibacter phyllosphaerae]MBB3969825.1 16S rRNA (cytidine1402-2'-O)-methyltransferase [Mucilaginibacter phyllosphaerae]TEW65200.1 SAM-dependent methyltransferase [Mucilaginibacter phyllosphaerae]GGH17317.1 S-adenosylmethionine-dependent methyltransferase [Mucilaginibacter phyllosphaerae]
MPNGTLFLIPVPLADEAAAQSFTPYLVDTINSVKEYIVENEKTARRFLKLAGLKTPQSELLIHDYGKHNRDAGLKEFFTGLTAGNDVGLMSEAGCPGIADPGADIVAEAHRKGIKVVPLVGPSSILLALMVSGFNGQSFTFNGYLPIDKLERSKRIKELEALAEKNKQTQLFIETPFRNDSMLQEVLKSCKPTTRLCIACDITAPTEFIKTLTIAEWQKQVPDLRKRPAIFLLFHA